MSRNLYGKLAGEYLRFRDVVLSRTYMKKSEQGNLANAFHLLYYNSEKWGKTWASTYWMGVKVHKCPLDLWLYQEIIHATRPDLIVETGTAEGGSALYMASLMDLIGHGRVVTVDIRSRERPKHPRITYVTGSSIAKNTFHDVISGTDPNERTMVILDSAHQKEHVLEELRLYSRLVSPGCYLIIEDTNLNGHPVEPSYGPGPMEALTEFTKDNKDFEYDESIEKFLLTFNPRGYLRRVRGGQALPVSSASV